MRGVCSAEHCSPAASPLAPSASQHSQRHTHFNTTQTTPHTISTLLHYYDDLTVKYISAPRGFHFTRIILVVQIAVAVLPAHVLKRKVNQRLFIEENVAPCAQFVLDFPRSLAPFINQHNIQIPQQHNIVQLDTHQANHNTPPAPIPSCATSSSSSSSSSCDAAPSPAHGASASVDAPDTSPLITWLNERQEHWKSTLPKKSTILSMVRSAITIHDIMVPACRPHVDQFLHVARICDHSVTDLFLWKFWCVENIQFICTCLNACVFHVPHVLITPLRQFFTQQWPAACKAPLNMQQQHEKLQQLLTFIAQERVQHKQIDNAGARSINGAPGSSVVGADALSPSTATVAMSTPTCGTPSSASGMATVNPLPFPSLTTLPTQTQHTSEELNVENNVAVTSSVPVVPSQPDAGGSACAVSSTIPSVADTQTNSCSTTQPSLQTSSASAHISSQCTSSSSSPLFSGSSSALPLDSLPALHFDSEYLESNSGHTSIIPNKENQITDEELAHFLKTNKEKINILSHMNAHPSNSPTFSINVFAQPSTQPFSTSYDHEAHHDATNPQKPFDSRHHDVLPAHEHGEHNEFSYNSMQDTANEDRIPSSVTTRDQTAGTRTANEVHMASVVTPPKPIIAQVVAQGVRITRHAANAAVRSPANVTAAPSVPALRERRVVKRAASSSPTINRHVSSSHFKRKVPPASSSTSKGPTPIKRARCDEPQVTVDSRKRKSKTPPQAEACDGDDSVDEQSDAPTNASSHMSGTANSTSMETVEKNTYSESITKSIYSPLLPLSPHSLFKRDNITPTDKGCNLIDICITVIEKDFNCQILPKIIDDTCCAFSPALQPFLQTSSLIACSIYPSPNLLLLPLTSSLTMFQRMSQPTVRVHQQLLCRVDTHIHTRKEVDMAVIARNQILPSGKQLQHMIEQENQYYYHADEDNTAIQEVYEMLFNKTNCSNGSFFNLSNVSCSLASLLRLCSPDSSLRSSVGGSLHFHHACVPLHRPMLMSRMVVHVLQGRITYIYIDKNKQNMDKLTQLVEKLIRNKLGIPDAWKHGEIDLTPCLNILLQSARIFPTLSDLKHADVEYSEVTLHAGHVMMGHDGYYMAINQDQCTLQMKAIRMDESWILHGLDELTSHVSWLTSLHSIMSHANVSSFMCEELHQLIFHPSLIKQALSVSPLEDTRDFIEKLRIDMQTCIHYRAGDKTTSSFHYQVLSDEELQAAVTKCCWIESSLKQISPFFLKYCDACDTSPTTIVMEKPITSRTTKHFNTNAALQQLDRVTHGKEHKHSLGDILHSTHAAASTHVSFLMVPTASTPHLNSGIAVCTSDGDSLYECFALLFGVDKKLIQQHIIEVIGGINTYNGESIPISTLMQLQSFQCDEIVSMDPSSLTHRRLAKIYKQNECTQQSNGVSEIFLLAHHSKYRHIVINLVVESSENYTNVPRGSKPLQLLDWSHLTALQQQQRVEGEQSSTAHTVYDAYIHFTYSCDGIKQLDKSRATPARCHFNLIFQLNSSSELDSTHSTNPSECITVKFNHSRSNKSEHEKFLLSLCQLYECRNIASKWKLPEPGQVKLNVTQSGNSNAKDLQTNGWIQHAKRLQASMQNNIEAIMT